MDTDLLTIENLSVEFQALSGVAKAVEGVNLRLGYGESLGLVGESGCGKSVTAMSILRLIAQPPGRIAGGRVFFEGRDLLKLSNEEIRRIRGRYISMIFQEPMTSLNPVFTIGRQVAEPLMVHFKLPWPEAMDQAAELLDKVKIPAARHRLQDYPHQLSGGMRQRVMIAMALACRPKLIIADEPTTALDVTIQAQILSLLNQLKDELGTSVLLITHNLGVVAQMASRVVVMYAGQTVEEAKVKDLFDRPFHPYTKGLLRSMPKLGSRTNGTKTRLQEIPGLVPALTEIIPGCKFADRCREVFPVCRTRRPEFTEVAEGHWVRCWLANPGAKGTFGARPRP